MKCYGSDKINMLKTTEALFTRHMPEARLNNIWNIKGQTIVIHTEQFYPWRLIIGKSSVRKHTKRKLKLLQTIQITCDINSYTIMVESMHNTNTVQ